MSTRHPTAVPPKTNQTLKQLFASRTDKYTYAFAPKGYTDFDVYNITGTPTVDRGGVGRALATSDKPVVFFLCYDVGYDPNVDRFIRHIVCCVAFGSTVVFFDMRNLCDISPDHQALLEKELARKSGLPTIKLVNASCLGDSCTYLQRFKSKKEIGWCIAWALFFLNTITEAPYPGLSLARFTTATKKLYRSIDATLEKRQSNGFIEEWYNSQLQSQ